MDLLSKLELLIATMPKTHIIIGKMYQRLIVVSEVFEDVEP